MAPCEECVWCFFEALEEKKRPYTAALTFSLSLDLPYLTVRPMLDADHKCAVCVKGILLERMKHSYVFRAMKMLTHSMAVASTLLQTHHNSSQLAPQSNM